MARLVEKSIKKPLSELLLFGDVHDGSRIVVTLKDGTLQLSQADAVETAS
jgi:ATP-dependent Clp protease ATP-binding subunit ClpA